MTTFNEPAELTYTVRGGDGKEYGPVTFEQLSTWTRDGRIQPQSELRRSDMQHWARAGDFTELKANFPATLASPPSGTALPASIDPAAHARLKSGASWFYWIAGLSLINSISAFSGSSWRFIVGLGITQVFDGLASEFGASGKVMVLLLDLLATGVFVFFGVFASKRNSWAFIVGMVLYGLDGVVLLLFQDWLGVGFHVFVLYCLFRGLKACRDLKY
jgi:hypothetical protein